MYILLMIQSVQSLYVLYKLCPEYEHNALNCMFPHENHTKNAYCGLFH